MLAQVASGLGITHVQVMMDHMVVTLTFAVLSIAFEDMDTMLLIYPIKGVLEEGEFQSFESHSKSIVSLTFLTDSH